MGEARNTQIIERFAPSAVFDNDAIFYGTGKDVGMMYDINDANAHVLKTDFLAGGVNHVPVHVYGVDIFDRDLTFFNGRTEPLVAVVDLARTSWVSIGFRAAGEPAIEVGGVGTMLYLPNVTATEITIYSAENLFYLTESDQTDPAGRWRFRVQADILYLEHALTASWATDEDWITCDYGNGRITLDKPLIFGEVTAPAGTLVYIARDNTGDLTLNALTNKVINLAIAGADEVVISGAALYPATSDGQTLGSTANMWSDLYLASGGVINFNNGNQTITHDNATVTLTLTGKLAFGGNTDWGTGATGTEITGAGYDWVTQTIGRVNTDINNTAAAAHYAALSITVNQTNSNSFFGHWVELYVSNSVVLTGADNLAAVWGQFEAGTGVTLSDTGCFTAGVYANVKAGATLTVATGHSLNGVRAQLEVAAITNNGKSAAFECLIGGSGAVDWDYGLYAADITTGVYVGACTTGFTLAGACTTGIDFTGTYTGNCIDFTDITINHTGSAGPCMIRAGTYGDPATTTFVENADEDQSGMIRLYGATSANGTSYDRGIFVCLVTTGLKGIFPIAGLAEVRAQTGNGPTKVQAAQFICDLHTTDSKLAGLGGDATAGMYGGWFKITAIDGATISATARAAPIWLDNQLYGNNAAAIGEEYTIFSTAGGTVIKAWAGFETSSVGWSHLFYFDETAYDQAPVFTGGFKCLINATTVYIPYFNNDGTVTTYLGISGDYIRIGDAATTQVSLASEDDLMVSGKLEVYGTTYHTGVVFIGDANVTAEAVVGITTGIQIDQGAADNAVLVFKSSDVAHGGTSAADTDTWCAIQKVEAAAGGLRLAGFKDADGAAGAAVAIYGYLAENVDTTKSTAGRAIIELYSRQLSGASTADVVADGNIFALIAEISVSTTVMLVDRDGDLWLNGRITLGGDTPLGYIHNRLTATFTSDGASTTAIGLSIAGVVTGASGDTASLRGTSFANTIVTQDITETIGYIAQVSINEPGITKGSDTVTVAATLYISDAPTEGATNAAIYVASGNIYLPHALNTPDGMGADGEQLTSGGDNVAMDWAGAASLREYKDIIGVANAQDALDKILGTTAYHFHYKEGMGTHDCITEYIGLMSDEAPWAMHYNNRIVNPINTLGYMVLGFQAMNDRVEGIAGRVLRLEEELAEAKAELAELRK